MENILSRGRTQGSCWNRYDRNRLSVAGKELHFVAFMIMFSFGMKFNNRAHITGKQVFFGNVL